jgi:hypothetical protein
LEKNLPVWEQVTRTLLSTIEERHVAHSVSYCGAATCPELRKERPPSPTVSIRR